MTGDPDAGGLSAGVLCKDALIGLVLLGMAYGKLCEGFVRPLGVGASYRALSSGSEHGS